MKKEKDNVFGHKELAEELGKDPRLLNSHLIRLGKIGFLVYKGRKNDQHTYSVTKKVYDLANSINSPVAEKLVERKTQEVSHKILGKEIFSTTKVEKKEVSPKPSKVTDESQKSMSGGLETVRLSGQVSYAQSDRTRLEFEKHKTRKSKMPPEASYV
jgi:hypothetical protein